MMRSISLLVIPAALLAQSSTITYQTGVNGERIAVTANDQTPKGGGTQWMRDPVGRRIPTEQTTERILRDDAGGKLIERTIQKYDANGRPAGTERVTIEETPLAGGAKLSKETRAASDLNGRYSPIERRTTETRVSGQTTTTSVTVDRPTPSNAFQTAEKRNIVTVGPKDRQTSTETVERLDVSGRFNPVQRTETSVQATPGKTTESTAVYNLNQEGKFTLAKQTVATTTKGANGDVTETNVYATAALGRTASATDKLQLQQQILTERKVAADGSVIEVVSARTPNPSDPGKLGAARQISETICTGKCLPDTPAPAAPKPTAPAKP